MKNMICICCPRGCHLTVDEATLEVSGNFCPKGAEYGKNELTHPVRTVTGTVAISGGEHPRLPVRTNRAVPKDKIADVMAVLHSFAAVSPVKDGEVIIKNVAGTDADVIACKSM